MSGVVTFSLDDEDVVAVLPTTFVERLGRGGPGPSPFEVGLSTFPVQPWTNHNADPSQWFNYGMNPATWSKYALQQLKVWESYKAFVATESTKVCETKLR